jgi:hypothetical protein
MNKNFREGFEKTAKVSIKLVKTAQVKHNLKIPSGDYETFSDPITGQVIKIVPIRKRG